MNKLQTEKRTIIHSENINECSYITYIPKININKKVHILIWGSNAFESKNKYEDAKEIGTPLILKTMCDENNLILFTPVLLSTFIDNENISLNSQLFHRDVIYYEKELEEYRYYYRPDLKIINTLKSFKNDLSQLNIKVEEKLIIGGTSAGGQMANRFTILHTNLVKGCILMSLGNYAYPEESLLNTTLGYPLGTYNHKSISNSHFNKKEFLKIPHLIYVGEKDISPEQDPLKYELNNKQLSEIYKDLLGKNQVERASNYAKYLEKSNTPITFIKDSEGGHSPDYNKHFKIVEKFVKDLII